MEGMERYKRTECCLGEVQTEGFGRGIDGGDGEVYTDGGCLGEVYTEGVLGEVWMEGIERYIRTECCLEEVYTEGVLREFKVGIGEVQLMMNVMKKGGD